MALKIKRKVLDRIVSHAEGTYPEECCGLLLSTEGEVAVVEAIAMRNTFDGPRHNRYLIDPLELYRVEKALTAQGQEITGIYHSHPNHPSALSAYDLERAWPWYRYLVISILDRKFSDAKSWILKEDGTPLDDPLEVVEMP